MEDSNKVIDDTVEIEEPDINIYNFVTIPWDDRTKSSKIGIVTLLVAIFVATMACVINGLVMHYRSDTRSRPLNEDACFPVKLDALRFVSRIYLMPSQLVCLGAVIYERAVLVHKSCVATGPLRILGASNKPRCRKGFYPVVIENITLNGHIIEDLAVLKTYEDLLDCAETMKMGRNIDPESNAFAIGRPLHGDKYFSRHPVSIVSSKFCNLNARSKTDTICVKDSTNCPVGVGDLLVKNSKLYGFASTDKETEYKTFVGFGDLIVTEEVMRDMLENYNDDLMWRDSRGNQ